MRLFIAADLPEAVSAAVAAIAASLRSALASVPSRSRVTWVKVDRAHLTLVFVGEVSDAVGAEIASRLRAPLPVAPFAASLGRLGFFPAAGRPRVVWLAIQPGSDGLRSVHRSLKERLDGVPFAREEREFSPHLTIARFREPATRGERDALSGAALPPAPSGEVDRVTLYRSRLSPHGPEYTPLAMAPLIRGAAA